MYFGRVRPWRLTGATAAIATLALTAPLLPAQAAGRATPATTAASFASASPSSSHASATAVASPAPAGAPGDMLLTGLGDTSGYHLYVARSSDGYAWRPLATLSPGGPGQERWIGRQCLTGDGTTAVAVVAPWHTANTPAGNDRGATAVAVNLASGQTRVLATGVATYYFNPGCGTGSDVTLTRYLGPDEQTTQVLDVNAATGSVRSARTVHAEITGAVPAGDREYALRGDQVVRLGARGVTTVATVPQTPVTLAPGSAGLDVLSSDRAHSTTLWRYSAGHLRTLGHGGISAQLFTGRAGITVAAGTTAGGVAGTRALAAGGGTLGVSTLGDLELAAPARSADRAGNLLPRILNARGAVIRPAAKAPVAAHQTPFTGVRPADPAAALPTADFPGAAPSGTAVPARGIKSATNAESNAAGSAAGTADTTKAGTASGPGAKAASSNSAASGTSPACAIARADLSIQAPQPTNAQIDWAAQLAVQGALPSRPAGFDNLTDGYSPESDFKVPALDGAPAAHVPAVLVEAIMAQESNMNQASWHVPAGMAGDPLIADYYGNAGDSSAPIDYTSADCGYGLGQITDIMFAGSAPLVVQQRVAVDYAENAAAIVSTLAGKWNQLFADGTTVNDANPAILENWYDAIWAYNSGVEPNAANGNLSACTPGPSCTDSSGNWGLGWANNPINPVYPAGREQYLSGPNGYADAATPGDWPYQERVFGWMSVPLQRYDPGTGGEEAAYTAASGIVTAPPAATFCGSTNNCDTSGPNGQFCQYTDSVSPLYLHCWFHGKVQIDGGCSTGCNVDTALASRGTAEPAATNPDPPTCSPDNGTLQPGSAPPQATTTIVTDEALPAQNPGGDDINLAGCAAGTGDDGWEEGGTFGLSNVWDASGNPLPGQIDVHQLSGGFGGHMWFDHEVSRSDTADTVTATWTPNLTTASTGAGVYRVYVFVPDVGATANAVYTVNENYARPGGASSAFTSTVKQGNASGWVDIGAYYLRPGANLSLTNNTDSSGDDLGINAVAFTRLTQDSAGPSWAALGDSYSSGEGAGNWDPATDQSGVNMCHRSGGTYSAVAWPSSGYPGGYALTACSGAVSSSLGLTNTSPSHATTYSTAGQDKTQPPQYAALSSSTSLVTLTMGGNDINFGPILQDCVLTFLENLVGQNSSPDCVGDAVTSQLDPQLTIPTNPTNPKYEVTQLEADYLMIHQQAPSAKIVVLTYPNILESSISDGCTGLTANDINWLSGEYRKFTADIKTAVSTEAAAGVPVSVVDESQSFTGHEICSPAPWVNTINPANLSLSQIPAPWAGDHFKAMFFHPTAAGYAQEAKDLTSYLQANGL